MNQLGRAQLLVLLLLMALVLTPRTAKSGLKEVFLRSLPDENYYLEEKSNFERFGRKLNSIVLVVPFRLEPAELEFIGEYAERMSKVVPFTVLWYVDDVQYLKSVVSVTRRHRFRSRIYLNCSARVPEGVEVWLWRDRRWIRVDGPSNGYGEGMWRCDEIYHGLMRVDGDVWWFYRVGPFVSGCVRHRPQEWVACDVHMIFKARFLGMGEGRALITFPGSQPAVNCGGDCGYANTKLEGKCKLTYGDLGDVMFVSYMMTHTKADPCPYYSYCGCLGKCDHPQLFISDVIQVVRMSAGAPHS